MSVSKVFLLFCLCCLTIFPVNADLKIHFLDVDDGDAVLLQADDKTMLIDSGTANSGNLTRYYLQELGITRLDQVLVTSTEEGRTGGLTNILNATPVDSYFDGGWNSSGGSYQDIINKMQEDQMPMTRVTAGNSIPFVDGVNISLLKPANKSGTLATDTLIPFITYGNFNVLLMGTHNDVPEIHNVQIVRVPDHGSSHSIDPEFIIQVHPEIAIVSTGGGASIGYPEYGTINTLQTAGAEVMRTDSDGTIIIETDGKSVSVTKLRMEPEITLSLVSVVETRSPS
ncbi:MAG: hypothetical protein LUQ50_11800 [Methanospirillum sp.]|uniref:ComEC/Rec2 family competence protein n=1 Tax=Methanospirillum sp. TaxID=45200 RepID=UPI002371AF8F|nr:hypothetical protein [Methanospirillum sp.]MDD1729739.1 hypothetical protein [Methanospirillum sp.]